MYGTRLLDFAVRLLTVCVRYVRKPRKGESVYRQSFVSRAKVVCATVYVNHSTRPERTRRESRAAHSTALFPRASPSHRSQPPQPRVISVISQQRHTSRPPLIPCRPAPSIETHALVRAYLYHASRANSCEPSGHFSSASVSCFQLGSPPLRPLRCQA